MSRPAAVAALPTVAALANLLCLSPLCLSLVACGGDETVAGPQGLDASGGSDDASLLDGQPLDAEPTDTDLFDVAGGDAGSADVPLADNGAQDVADPDAPTADGADAAPLPCVADQQCPASDLPCQKNVCGEAGQCQATNLPDGQECEDGDACTGGDSCAAGGCVAGKAPDCSDANPCTLDLCDPKTGCQHLAQLPMPQPCDDGNPCTGDDGCQGGACVGGAPVNCDDGNPCTDDTCLSAKGCSHDANGAGCEDGDPCTSADTCVGGKCAGGGPMPCNDGNPCTADGCAKGQGCTHLPTAAPCDDGNPCTVGDACAAGTCAPGAAKTCDDNNACTDDSCAAPQGCVNLPNQVPCSDGSACTGPDACAAGACVPGKALVCDDGNPCTTDACLPASGCAHSANVLPCDDGNPCTSGDTCKDGACAAGKALACADGNPCTDDGCDPKAGCTSVANALPCDDGNKCTLLDTCKNGTCTPGKAPDCDDGNPCTTSSCAPGEGCANLPNKLPCTDGNLCTSGDACAAGACVPGPTVVCDDGNGCTDDACDKDKGCVALANAATCSDGNLCTQGDQCAAGVCGSGAALTCDDGNPCTVDQCVPDKGCVAAPAALGCDDGSICTAGDLCKEGACVPGKPLPCADGNACTDDGCDKVAGCTFSLNTAPCDDGNACSGEDACAKGSCVGQAVVCDDGSLCTLDYCDSAVGCKTLPVPGPCDDGDVCTVSDACKAGACVGQALDCDDGNPCSVDTCDKLKGCAHPPAKDGAACGLSGSCAKGQCELGTVDAPAASCSELRQMALPGPVAQAKKSGVYWIDPDGKAGVLPPFQARCEMGYQGGGWTLVATSSDDGQSTWTWNNRAAWTTNTKTFGSPTQPGRDLKSAAYHQVGAQQVLFVHQPSGVWARYQVGDGTKSLGALQTAWGDPQCVDVFKQGFAMQAGTLAVGGKLCSTRLFWATLDMDGTPGCGDDDHSYGPTWSARNNAATCHLDDPGLSGGLGPVASNAAAEAGARGFGAALLANVGKAGAAENYLQIYVRQAPAAGCGDGELKAPEGCDDGNLASGDGCDSQCAVEVYPSCKAVPAGAPDGVYTIDPDGDGPIAARLAWCDMGHDGGGWTLLAISADDGKASWTWDKRALWTTDKTTFGSLDAPNADYKSPALHDLPFKDVLAVHAPSGVWAAWSGVGDGKATLAAHIAKVAGPVCHKAGSGHPMTAGNLVVGQNLCESRLYFNAHDHDGNATTCGDNDATWGPSFSGKANNGCPFDDPADTGSFGPRIGSPGSEAGARGFGAALGLNSAPAGQGHNNIRLLVR